MLIATIQALLQDPLFLGSFSVVLFVVAMWVASQLERRRERREQEAFQARLRAARKRDWDEFAARTQQRQAGAPRAEFEEADWIG
ncbi:MAG TPA: hypothetical protein VJN95_08890 [Gemmatimonadales bacterium]|nr:hypothetical protein [Gemmatimonadales bacterium]